MDSAKPSHADALLHELETTTDVRATLLRYVGILPADNSLMNAYLRLGFAPEASDFSQAPTRALAIDTITREYEVRGAEAAPEDAESDFDLRQNFLRTYAELGLQGLGTAMDFEPGPEYYLTDLWGCSTPTLRPDPTSSPRRRDVLRTVSTRASHFTTPTSWVSNYESADEDGPQGVRGLKRLAAMVKAVVSSKRAILHKEVVSRIIQEVGKSVGTLREKEEKNIKRRLYDAINVLLAAGSIVKEGRSLVWKGDVPCLRSARPSSSPLHEKESTLRDLVHRHLALKQLLTRNAADPMQAHDLPFPFILGATPDSPSNSVRTMQIAIVGNATSTKVKVKIALPTIWLGDVEVLLRLPLGRIDPSTAESWLPPSFPTRYLASSLD